MSVIEQKITTIKRCLKRIRDVTQGDPQSLYNLDVEDIFVLNLERAIHATIDIAQYIVSQRSYGPAQSYRDNFYLLAEHDLISSTTLERCVNMVGFRNIAIHDYQSISKGILQAILVTHLNDFEIFYHEILENMSKT